MSELKVEELCELIGKAEQAARKGKDSVADAQRAVDILKRFETSVTSAKVFQAAQQKDQVGKRLRKLKKSECVKVANVASKVVESLADRFKREMSSRGTAAAPQQVEARKEKSSGTNAPDEAEKIKASSPNAGNGNPIEALRLKVRSSFLESLLLACQETGTEPETAENGSQNLEHALFNRFCEDGQISKDYKTKMRSLTFNLKDKSNPDLRRKVLLGIIPAKEVIELSPHQLASDKRKEDNVEIKKVALFNAEAAAPTVASTDQFRCGKCGKRKCTYYQMQTRSADEPMTTFVTCTVCNNRW
eukprot:CAMPEP_0198238046 /NCGR_PEP_ID=MMETSP1446-20131203/3776_1 /TAXON_ID=1461542 ORGANISM="Unidentified sp, Strain CCMP2111" /NCGR_SAMPLE_ID=MMETSP1446 /ASSEMBLY_ACC=CAM_ASM_001112 /LENGTH=302 /DNA_ID=CAMNT_0043920367 /DNA_START=243 /DNA_END=1148 /DNA_ORIENTATION=-